LETPLLVKHSTPEIILDVIAHRWVLSEAGRRVATGWRTS
jgi:hypothetical protein